MRADRHSNGKHLADACKAYPLLAEWCDPLQKAILHHHNLHSHINELARTDIATM